jgi:hypothetical protein
MSDGWDARLRGRLSQAAGEVLEGDWTAVERLARPGGTLGQPIRRSRGRRRTLVVALVLAAVVAAPAFAFRHRITALFASPSPVVVRAVTVPALPTGWTILSSAPYILRPGGTQAETILTSWRYQPSPFGPAGSIPPGGIMISIRLLRSQAYGSAHVNLCRDTPNVSGYPATALPLNLPDETTSTLEGSPSVQEFRILGRYRNYYNFEVRVDIDTRRPVARSWKTADGVVRGLRFPAWPRVSHC